MVLVIAIIVIVLLALQKKLCSLRQLCGNETVLFLLASAATGYVLAIAPTPEDRAYFGAGIFLFAGCIQGIVDVSDKEQAIRAAKYSLVSVLCAWCFLLIWIIW